MNKFRGLIRSKREEGEMILRHLSAELDIDTAMLSKIERGENELIDDPRWKGYDVPPKSNANYGWILNMVSKLSVNGVAGFILANGALSGGSEEYKIRKKLIENNLIEAVIIIPRDTFYTTDISVTLWIINRNKKERTATINDLCKNYRNREKEVLFMDLRRWGSEYEKKFVQLTEDDIQKVATHYHNWQQKYWGTTYKNILRQHIRAVDIEQYSKNKKIQHREVILSGYIIK